MKRTRILLSVVATMIIVLGLIACGQGEATAAEASGEGEASASAAAAPEGTPLDTSRFATVLPDGWKIHADDLEKMGMMTITYGTRYEGVYFKFEHNGSYTKKPIEDLAGYAKRMEGTGPTEVTVNDVVWASTEYEYGGQKQSMMITNHNGAKVTLTIVGEPYGTHPGVTEVIDKLVLK